MKNKIPLREMIYLIIIVFLLLLRIFSNENLNRWISLINYTGMAIAFSSNGFSAINEAEENRKRNICISILAILICFFVIFGCCSMFLFEMSNKINDVITLFALLFCICHTIMEKICCAVFGLTIKK